VLLSNAQEKNKETSVSGVGRDGVVDEVRMIWVARLYRVIKDIFRTLDFTPREKGSHLKVWKRSVTSSDFH